MVEYKGEGQIRQCHQFRHLQQYRHREEEKLTYALLWEQRCKNSRR